VKYFSIKSIHVKLKDKNHSYLAKSSLKCKKVKWGGLTMNIGNISLRNEFIMAPVKTGYGTKEGDITQRHIRFYQRRAKYIGAIIPEPFFIDSRVKELPTQIGIDHDEKIAGLKQLTEVIHQEGAKAIAHINHPGRMSNPNLPGNISISSSEQVCESGGKQPEALTKDGIKEVIELFKQAAIRAEKSGFDFIELQFGHGYLVAQFLSPKVNDRTDEYGGTFENRTRFALEILDAVQHAVSIPIITRISGSEMVEDGIDLEEMSRFAQILQEKGVAAIHVSAGSACSTPPWYFQHMAIPKGKTWNMASEIKKNLSIPVITVGQINDFADVDYIKENKLADFIAIGRPMIADPDFVGKYYNQAEGILRPCNACLDGCLGGVKAGKGLMCAINSLVGREEEELIEKVSTPKKYAVVGGGLAGMQAAVTLKEKGHEVILYEKNRLGGQFNLASLPPHKEELTKVVQYLEDRVKEQKVPVLQKEATAEELIDAYDGVVLATGSKPFIPPIEGLTDYSWAEIMEEDKKPKGKKVLVIGGGLIGIEVAESLTLNDNEVVIVEMLEEVARGMEMISKKLALGTLKKQGVKIYTSTKVTKIDGDKAYLESEDGKEVLSGFDHIVVTTGMKSNSQLKDQLEGKIPYYIIGDAKQIGKQLDAIQTAYFTAKEL